MLARSNAQQEIQPKQVPATNFSVLPPQVKADMSHQQAEIIKLAQVTQQWVAEGPCQYNQAPANNNQDRFSTTIGRGTSV